MVPSSVKIMREKMDPEELGIITLNGFMDEFFPSNAQSEAIQTFTVFHYNGLPSSGPGHKVDAAFQAQMPLPLFSVATPTLELAPYLR